MTTEGQGPVVIRHNVTFIRGSTVVCGSTWMLPSLFTLGYVTGVVYAVVQR